jgi:sugar O-acyltransferase (sialic acid O-acetyltransferase NeuD family)
MEHIILIGGGGHCKSVIDVIESSGLFKISGIIDLKENIGNKVLDYDIIGTDDDLPSIVKSFQNFHISIGHIKSNANRIKLYNIIKLLNGKFPVIVSPNAFVSKHAVIGEGTIIMHQALLNAGVKIGYNTIINTKALIEHDAVIGNHCHISTGGIVNGGVEIGNNTFYGSGAVSKQYIKISENSYIKANSIVKDSL